jgi:hypothetical protein
MTMNVDNTKLIDPIPTITPFEKELVAHNSVFD